MLDGGADGAHTIDIFDSSYQHLTHVDLPYQPRATNGIAAVGDWIVVAKVTTFGDPCLCVYNWQGEELGTVTKEELALDRGYVLGIGHAGVNGLIVAAGDNVHVKSLSLYHFH